MMTRLPRPVADRVMLLATELDLSYSETLALLVERGLDSGQPPGADQEAMPESA